MFLWGQKMLCCVWTENSEIHDILNLKSESECFRKHPWCLTVWQYVEYDMFICFCVCSEPRLPWSYAMRHGRVLPETRWIHDVSDFKRVFSLCESRNLLFSKIDALPVCYATSALVQVCNLRSCYYGIPLTAFHNGDFAGVAQCQMEEAILKLYNSKVFILWLCCRDLGVGGNFHLLQKIKINLRIKKIKSMEMKRQLFNRGKAIQIGYTHGNTTVK